MTATAATSLGRPDRMLGVSLGHLRPGRRQVTPALQGQGPSLAVASAGQTERPEREVTSMSGPTSPSGVIGGAIIKAARRSAQLTRRSLARMLQVSTATVRGWENGAVPLFCLPYDQLRQLAAALNGAGARVGHELPELLLASRCDLLVAGMLHGFEDYAEVPPIDEDGTDAEAARDLLRWALSGPPPERCRQYASPCPLLENADVTRLANIAGALQAGAQGADLAGYGAALATLISQ